MRSTETLYFVYVNNLTPAAVARIEQALSGHAACLGYMDLMYTSGMKAAISETSRVSCP